jgi:hypothetical protein
MKTFYTFLGCCLIICGSLTAQIRTVSQDEGIPAQYSTIQAAVDAAQAGDTIYVYGSDANYVETVTINKRLVLIGAGYNPNKQNRTPTKVQSISIIRGTATAANPSGTIISGFEIFSSVDIYKSSSEALAPTDLIIERCKINSLSRSSGANLLIRHNIINYLYLYGGWTSGSGANISIHNNIIRDLSAINSGTTFVSNNIIQYVTATIKNSTWVNNILLGETEVDNPSPLFINAINGIAGNTFNNNLVATTVLFSTSEAVYYTPSTSIINSYYYDATYQGVNSGNDNLEGVNPMFENRQMDKPLDFYLNDYRLKTGSPGKNAGTDGKDIGIYGGSNPWPDGGAPGSGFQLSPMPAIPHITNMIILNPIVPLGEAIQVDIKAQTGN